MVLANKHYYQHGWELVSTRKFEDHIRDEVSTFTSIAYPNNNECCAWEFKKIDPLRNKYIISLHKDDAYGQAGWKLCAEI